jgi:CheY-like chemotaxis protein
MILKQSGYVSKAVFSGEEAVAAAAEFKPDVLLSDFLMAGINGIDAAIELQQICPACRAIIYYSSFAPADLLEKAWKHNFEVYAAPIHPKTILELLEKGPPK